MRITTRTPADTSLSALTARVYGLNEDDPSAEKALIAANGDLLTDFARVPLGASILVPRLANADFVDAPDPLDPRAARLNELARTLDGVTGRVYDEHVGALAELDRSEEFTFAQFQTGPLPRDAKPRRDELLTRRDGVLARFRPLADDVQRLRRILGAPAIVHPQPRLQIKRFRLTGPQSGNAGFSRVRLHVPAPFKILGGGALINFTPGFPVEGGPVPTLLTASRPEGVHTWMAHGKNHLRGGFIQLTVEVAALFDPDDDWEVAVFESLSAVAQHPSGTVSVAPGFVMTGGGAQVLYRGPGNLLTSSHPADATTWFVASKDHDQPDPAPIAPFAIGLRSRRGIPVATKTFEATSALASRPGIGVSVGAEEGLLVGGGGHINFSEPGNLLITSIFDNDTWRCEGTDHINPSPATATAYAIGLAGASLLRD